MITFQELMEQKLIYMNTITDSSIIEDLINSHDISEMVKGEKYYYNESDVLERQRYYWKDKQRQVDETKPNIRIPHNWHKLLVDQKVSYLVSTPPIFQVEDEKNKSHEERLNLILGEEWHDTLNEIGTDSSNKGTDWLHVYIDREGLFKFVIIPPEEVVPIYDTSLEEDLEAILRYYFVEVNGDPRIRVEWWTRERVTFYIQNKDGVFVADDTEEQNPDYHYYYNKKGHGWGKVPFIEFPNNSKRVSDLKFYKELIDAYDSNVSDLGNDLEEVQEVLTVLKGYDGTNLSEFNDNKRYYKAVKVSESGDVTKLEMKIPVEAKREMLNRLEENIFLFGQGVNVKTDKFGDNASGVALKFLYASLDLKASTMERKFRRSVKRLLWFATEYINIVEKKKYKSTDVQVTFKKTMIANDKENVEIANASKGIISDETIIANHPWVENVSLEMERLEQGKEAYIDVDRPLDDEGDNNPEEEDIEGGGEDGDE